MLTLHFYERPRTLDGPHLGAVKTMQRATVRQIGVYDDLTDATNAAVANGDGRYQVDSNRGHTVSKFRVMAGGVVYPFKKPREKRVGNCIASGPQRAYEGAPAYSHVRAEAPAPLVAHPSYWVGQPVLLVSDISDGAHGAVIPCYVVHMITATWSDTGVTICYHLRSGSDKVGANYVAASACELKPWEPPSPAASQAM